MNQPLQNWRQLIVIQAGGALCLPLFVIGYELAKLYGFFSAMLGIILGNAILCLLAMMMFEKCFNKRLSTAELSTQVFGHVGKYFFSAVMVISMIGWFAIQLIVMSDAIAPFINLSNEHFVVLRVVLGSLTLFTAAYGLKGLESVANLSLPLLCLTIGYAVMMSSHGDVIQVSQKPFDLAGTAFVIAACISAVIDLPTFFRTAKKKRDGKIAIALLFCCVVPLIQIVGVYLCIQSKAENLPDVLALASSHILWKIWIALFILFAGWTTNNTNIYSASVNMKQLINIPTHSLRVMILGSIGIAVSIIPLTENFETILNLIGVLLSGMGAVILLNRINNSSLLNLIAWLSGIGIGILSFINLIKVTGIPLLDTFIITTLMKCGQFLIDKNNNQEQNRIILGAENETN